MGEGWGRGREQSRRMRGRERCVALPFPVLGFRPQQAGVFIAPFSSVFSPIVSLKNLSYSLKGLLCITSQWSEAGLPN